MRRAIVSILTVIMLVVMILPVDIAVARGRGVNTAAAANATAIESPLAAGFDFELDCSVCGSKTVRFTDRTTGGTEPYQYDWDFGDGTPHSSEQDPTHSYATNGTYTVILTVTDEARPRNIDSLSQTVIVGAALAADSESATDISPTGVTGAWPRCIDGCTAKDVTVADIWLVVHGCTGADGNATADVYVEFDNNAKRYCFVFVADFWIDGVLSPENDDLSYELGDVPAKTDYTVKVATITWPCGARLEVKDILVMWQSNNGDCGYNCGEYKAPSKCHFDAVGSSAIPSVIVTQSTDNPCPEEDVVVTAHVTDADGTVTSVDLTYDSTTISMSLTGGTAEDGYWEATIPGQPAGTTLTIVVTAEDNDGNTVSTSPHDKTWIDCGDLDDWYEDGDPYTQCDGDLVCTYQDMVYLEYDCVAGGCLPTETDRRTDLIGCLPCDDGDPCTIDACVDGQCVHIWAGPNATASSNSPVIQGGTIYLYGGPAGMASYYWTGPDGWTSTLQNPTRSGANAAMAGTYALVVTDEYDCSDSDDVLVMVGGPDFTVDTQNYKVVNMTIAQPGDTLSFTIYYWNTGNMDATGVVITDVVDVNLENVTPQDGGIYDAGTRTITWNIGDVAVDTGGSVSFTADIVSPLDNGTVIYNTGTIDSDQTDPADTNTTETTIGSATPPVTPAGGGGGGGSTTKYLTVDWEGRNTTKPLYSNDKLAVDLLGPSPDGSDSLFLERGTHAPTVDGKTHYLIVVREIQEIPAVPENLTAIVVFNITPVEAVFDRDIFLTIGIEELPENALNVTLHYYDDFNGVWVPLEYEAGGPSGVAELTLSAPINHFSIFGVLAELAPPPPPAHFKASGLNIAPSVEKIWERVTFMTKTGETVSITATITNDGGEEGTFTAALKLNGQTVDTETVTLSAGQTKQVSFTRSGLDYGQYDVDVAGLSGTLTVSRAINWWLIIGLIAAIGLIIWGVVWRKRRRRARQEA